MKKYSVFDMGLDNFMRRPLEIASPVGVAVGALAFSGANELPSGSLSAGEMADILYSAKTSFSSTANGYRWGKDVDGDYKWTIGNSSTFIDWDVTTNNTLTISGDLTVNLSSTAVNRIKLTNASVNSDLGIQFERLDGASDPIMYFTYWGQNDRNVLSITEENGIGIHVNTSGEVIVGNFTASNFTGTGIFVVMNGNVGIGTTTPSTLLHVGLAGTTLGTIGVAGNTSGLVTIQPAAAAGTWSFTLPASGGTANYALTTNGSGVSSWAQLSLTAGVTGVLPVANGGTNASSASITAFNNITGYTSSGATGTTSTNLVFSTLPIFATTIGIGGATASASGSGVSFPATQGASTDVNTLDDYEEGSWTPSVGGDATYTSQVGTYIKIGKMVFINCDFEINVIGTGSTTLISGLPFTAKTTKHQAIGVSYFSNLAINQVYVGAKALLNTTTMNFMTAAAAVATMTDGTAIMGNGSRFILAGCYEATA